MNRIRFAGIEEDSYLPYAEVDEHTNRRRTESRFAPLSVEERAYLAQQGVEEGRIAQVRDELDYADNVSCGTVAKALLVGVGVVGAISVMLSWGF